MDKDTPIFGKKSFAELAKNIYQNRLEKDRKINLILTHIQSLIKTVNEAAMVGPLLKEFTEVSVMNDEHLVKLLAIIQRMIAASTKATEIAGSDGLTEEEKAQLLGEVENEKKGLGKEIKQLADETKKLQLPALDKDTQKRIDEQSENEDDRKYTDDEETEEDEI